MLDWLIDHELNAARLCRGALPDGGAVCMLADGAGGHRELLRYGMEDFLGTDVIGFTPDNTGLYMLDTRGFNAAAAVRIDLATGERSVLAQRSALRRLGRGAAPHDACAAGGERPARTAQLDRARPGAGARIYRTWPRRCAATSRSTAARQDDTRWLIGYMRDDGPVEYYVYDRSSGALSFLFNHRDDLAHMPLTQHAAGAVSRARRPGAARLPEPAAGLARPGPAGAERAWRALGPRCLGL